MSRGPAVRPSQTGPRSLQATMPLVDQAIKFLVQRHWPMLPSSGVKKKPCVGWKTYQEQLPSEGDLRDWGRQFKPERWGVVTGRLARVVVIDFDGDLGLALMREWHLTPHVRTGSGGFHIYVEHPGWKVPTMNAKAGKGSWPWPGVDVRGDGGFAVLLGRNQNGPYLQLRELVAEPFHVLPPQLRDYLRQHSGQYAQQQSVAALPPVVSAAGRVEQRGFQRRAEPNTNGATPTSTGNPGLDVLADAIAERVYRRLTADLHRDKGRLLNVDDAAEYIGRTSSALLGRVVLVRMPADSVWQDHRTRAP